MMRLFSYYKSRVVSKITTQDSDMGWIVHSGLGSPGGPNFYANAVIGSLGNQPWTEIIFRGIYIPKGATISSAVLTVLSGSAQSATTAKGIVAFEDADSVADFTDFTNFDTRPITTAQLALDNIAAWDEHVEVSFPDLKDSLQEVINRAGWVPGNNIGLCLRDNGSTETPAAFRRIANYSHVPYGPPRIRITYT